MADGIYRATFIGDLYGRWDVQENPRPVRVRRAKLGSGTRQEIFLADVGGINPLGLPFVEAIEFFRKKKVVSPEVFRDLKEAHRTRAFAVKGIQDKYALEVARKGILEALEEGITRQEFVGRVRDVFETRGLGPPPADWHLGTVFRTNVLQAYAAGRFQQMRVTIDSRPYWQYFTVGDEFVRPSHAALHGVVRRADDPFWKTWFPSNGYNCRCVVVSVSQGELNDEALSVLTGPWDGMPDRGFETGPVEWLGIAA